MKMKAKNIVLSFLASSALVCLSLGVGLSVGSPVEAQAAQTTIFECPGASIRMNKQDGLNGIRFPMFMDDTTFNTLTSNATIQSEDVTFGTLIIPTDKLTGTLNVNTALAKNLVTYGYNENDDFVNVWTECTDEDYPDCMQGYAYIHSIPDTSLDRNLTAVGYYTVDGGASYVYTQPIERHVSYVADAAIKSGDYSEAQMLKLEDFLANYTLTFDINSETTTQQVKYGKTFNFPAATMETPVGSTLDWYEVDSGDKVVSNGTLTASKSATYKLQAVENVQYTTTIYNKENIFKADPSVTYRDGYYYSIYEDSKNRLWILKTASLEEILEGGSSGWGHSGKAVCVYEPKEGDILGAEVWAPELTYIQGKWYIYVCGVAYGTVRGDGNNMKMFVLECESQDPTGTWKDPVRLYPKGFDDYYTIDGHAFEYKGQLYYVFSGQKEGWLGSIGEDRRPLLYITKMSSPTECTNDTAVCISKGTDLEEGPCTIVDGDDVYLMYSAGTWNGGDYDNSNDYHLEYYKLSGTNLLSSNSWSEMGVCLEHDASKDIYAVGHNHIFKNADGSLWTSYHGIVGTEDAGTDAYLAKRRCMVQPISIENGELNFGGIQDTVVITDKGGLQYNNAEKTEYLVDGYGSARLWKNNGRTFTASTTITRLSSEKDYCAGITLYERKGNGTLNKLLIGVEEEGNLFFCKDYSRGAYKYKYVGWQWDNEGTVNLTVTYTAGASTAESTITIEISNSNNSKSKTHTYTLDQINAIVSDNVGNESYAFDLHFTGDFEIGLGGNRGKCKFTNVSFDFEKFDISFVDAYGNKTTTSYEYGNEFELPEVAEREGFVFLGWAERTDDDTYAEPTLTPNLTVTGAKEYVAMFEAVGPTYEKPALESKIYTHKTLVVNNEKAEMFADGAGAYFFKDVELAQDEAFVMYATIKGGFTSDQIGFVVGTLEATSNHLFFNWRANDIYIWRSSSWTGHADNIYKPGFGTEANDIEIALVYANEKYSMFFNGSKVFSTGANLDNGWGGTMDIPGIIGTTGTKKIGLTQYAGESIYSDWGYSTDVNEIAKYVEIDTTLGSELYTGTTKALENGILTYNASTFGAQTFNDVEIAQGENFVVYATVESGMTAKNVGFVLGTFETSSNFLMFHFRRSQADFATFRDGGGYGWAGTADGIFPCQIGTSGAEIALVYKDGTYYAFLNGQKVCSFGSSYSNGWGGTFNLASQIGTSGALKVGLSIFEGTAQFSEWGVSTEESVIETYFPKTFEKPAIGSNIYKATSDRKIAVENNNLIFNAEKGAVFFKGAEVEQGQSYVIYATLSSLENTPDGIGFAVGTLASNNANHALFVWRSSDIYVVRMGDTDWGWNGETSQSCSKTQGAAQLALVYKEGVYYMFIDGDKVFEWSETAVYAGWGAKIQNMVGTEGTIKLGLANLSSDATFTDWGYSVDANVVDSYFPKKVEYGALESKLYTSKTLNVSATQAEMFADKEGAYFLKDVEIEQNQDFVIYATVKSGFADNIGFAVGTLEATSNHIMFQWRKNDIYVWRSAGGWKGHADNAYTPGFGNKDSNVTIALVYKAGYYYMFMNGTQVFSCNETSDIGWGTIPQSLIGTTGTKKIGFSLYAGEMIFTNWGYSTDARVVAQYVK